MVVKGASAGHSEMQLMTWPWKDSPGSLQWRGICGSPRLECHQEHHRAVMAPTPWSHRAVVAPTPWHGVGLGELCWKSQKAKGTARGEQGCSLLSPTLPGATFLIDVPHRKKLWLSKQAPGSHGTVQDWGWKHILNCCSFPSVRSCGRAGQNLEQTVHRLCCSPLKYNLLGVYCIRDKLISSASKVWADFQSLGRRFSLF